MTNEYIRRQDAVDEINVNADGLEQNGGIPYAQGARAMAIVVEQMPPADVAPVVRCDDAVSRKAVKSMTCNHCGRIDCEGEDNCIRMIDVSDLPSVVRHEKMGMWVLHTYMPHKKYCSECGEDSPYNKRWIFCPNCGAKMDREE